MGLEDSIREDIRLSKENKYNWWLLRKNEEESKGIEQEKEAKCLKRNTLK